MSWQLEPNSLRNRVAVVAGATRGAGRGIAAALGEAGATVICTGRSSRTGKLKSDYDRAETIEETAELVTALGGVGIAEVVDHLESSQVQRPGGLLVEVSDGTHAYNEAHYRISVFYDLAKVAMNRLAFSQGHELKEHGATAVCITPGWLRSEMMLEAFHTTEADWQSAKAPPGFATSESTRYVGRAVAALAADAKRARWNQQSVSAAQLAREYGFTDTDGSRPDAWGYMQAVEDGNADADPKAYR